MKIEIEYIEGQIKATATNDKGNTASYSIDLGIASVFINDDALSDKDNLINSVVYSANKASSCAVSLLEGTFKEPDKNGVLWADLPPSPKVTIKEDIAIESKEQLYRFGESSIEDHDPDGVFAKGKV